MQCTAAVVTLDSYRFWPTKNENTDTSRGRSSGSGSENLLIAVAGDFTGLRRWAFSMRVWGLETHPLLTSFRKIAADVCQVKDAYFHLFLPPPYCQTDRDPLDYFFFADATDPTTLYCHSNSKYTMSFPLIAQKNK